MRLPRMLPLAVPLLLTASLAASPASAAPHAAKINVGKTGLGRVLVDAHGKTLYLWAHDTGSKSTCSGACAKAWPPVVTKGKPVVRGGAKRGLVGTSRRADGRRQVTYNGHPLYTFIGDTKPGQTKGEGLTGFGGRWDPVSTAGKAVRKRATTSAYQAQAPVRLKMITPTAGEKAGAGGAFNVALSLQARNAAGNRLLSAANGYAPFFNQPGSPTFGPGMKDPGAPGLVVTLSSTPAAAGGPNANLAGVFQLNTISRRHGLIRTLNDWQVTSPGFFGKGRKATLTAYIVRGTAPGTVPAGGLRAASNVVHEQFTIAG
jgi:predicted lipoprotein with Yx(FWY)xxD motif